ncbi:MAG: DUF1015 domain-containing protein [Kiritimatiellia bacterium]|jgi:uncharacterized protein (DUF1015 family)
MLQVKPFRAWRPAPEFAAQVAGVPYDVVDRCEAAALAAGNPHSFLRISRAEIELSPDVNPYAQEVYERAKSNFDTWRTNGVLIQEAVPTYYLYRLGQGEHSQEGIVACCHVDDYRSDTIKKHEKTRQEKEDDRTRHIDTLSAHTGPVLLTYRDVPELDQLMSMAAELPPLYDFIAPDGVRHTIWRMPSASAIQQCFTEVPAAYIADGHHRAASSVRVAEQRRAAGVADPDAEYNWFLTILFPAGRLRVLPYNRLVRDLNGLSVQDFIRALDGAFDLEENAPSAPSATGRMSMYLSGKWFGLRRRFPAPAGDPVAALDVSYLQDHLLSPILGVRDPRTDSHIEFVGGARGVKALEQSVDSGEFAVAFSMFPVTVSQLMSIADGGLTMPPKSTWFEPKPRSGLLVHGF